MWSFLPSLTRLENLTIFTDYIPVNIRHLAQIEEVQAEDLRWNAIKKKLLHRGIATPSLLELTQPYHN